MLVHHSLIDASPEHRLCQNQQYENQIRIRRGCAGFPSLFRLTPSAAEEDGWTNLCSWEERRKEDANCDADHPRRGSRGRNQSQLTNA